MNNNISNIETKIILFKWSTVIILIFLLAITSATQFFGIGPDFREYEYLFIKQGYVRDSVEPAYLIIRTLNDILYPNSVYFIFIFSVVLSISLKIKAFNKLSERPITALFYCLTALFFIHEYTQIRAAVSIGIFLNAIPDIIKNNKLKFTIKLFCATLFHYSAIIMIFCWIYVRLFNKNIVYIFIPFVGFMIAMFIGSMKELANLIYMVQEFIGLNKSGNVSDFIKPYNLKYLTSLLFLFLTYKILPEDNKREIVLFRIYSFGLCCFYYILPAQLPVIAVRLAEYYTPAFFIVFTNCANNQNGYKRYCLFFLLMIYTILYCYAALKTTYIL